MPDGATTTQVTRIVLGEQYMAVLLAGKPLTLSFPNPENPTHQFQITMDEATRVIMTGGVTQVEPKRGQVSGGPAPKKKPRKKKSR